LQDTDVDSILKHTGTEEDLDGNIKYEGKIRGFVLKYNCGLCVAYMAMAFVLQILIFFSESIPSTNLNGYLRNF